MSAAPMNAASMNEVRRGLIGAPDATLIRVIALLDAMTDRGEADRLVDAVRDRLARLRPSRPLRFERLLFTPLDPVIVRAPDWRPAHATIPRSAIVPIAATVRHRLGGKADDIDRLLLGRTSQDSAAVTAAGTRLWAAAADILARPPPPIRWGVTGLPEALYAPLAQTIAAVLGHLPALQDLVAEDNEGSATWTRTRLAPLLARVAPAPEAVRTMMMTLVLAALPGAAAALSAFSAAERSMWQGAADDAQDLLWARFDRATVIEACVQAAGADNAAQEVRRLAAMFAQMEQRCSSARERIRVRILRERLDTSCRARFAEDMAAHFVTPLQAARVGPDRTIQATLETSARNLRALECEGRRIGGAEIYDQLLAAATAEVDAAGAAGGLSAAGHVRLTEILAGADAAAALWVAIGDTIHPEPVGAEDVIA